MHSPAHPPSPPEVAFFRDDASTWFAAEVVRGLPWTSALAEPLDPELADIRIAFLAAPFEGDPPDHPEWLVLLPAPAEFEPREVVEAAMRAWPRSPWHRAAGPLPEEYVSAGFHALCPPHPPCPLGPGARDSLMEFLLGRTGALGRLARESRDGASRLLRVLWHSPESFADDILRERIRDEGARHFLQLATFLEAAEVAPEADDWGPFALERAALLERLSPLRYFTHPADFDRAAAQAAEWQDRYTRAYEQHYRAVLHAAEAVLHDAAPALAGVAELEQLNEQGRPVGGDAVRRLRRAIDQVRALPLGVDDRAARTASVTLGRLPAPITEVRLAAAAIMAALEVHRRRSAGARRSGTRREQRL